MKIDKPLSECTGEEIVASRRRTGFFAPDHKYPGINAPLERNPNVDVEGSLFDATPEEIVDSCSFDGFFSPDFKMLTREELDARGVHVRVTHDNMSDEEYIVKELRARGYSGYYRKESDGVVTRIIPLDERGRRDAGALSEHV